MKRGDIIALARRLTRGGGRAYLGTIGDGGAPFVTMVGFASDADGAPLLLLTNMARHSKHIAADSRVSLLIDGKPDAPGMNSPRITLEGRLVQTNDPDKRARYVAAAPGAKEFADLPGFACWRLEITGVHLVAGFGVATQLTPAEFLGDPPAAAPTAPAPKP